MNWIDLKGYEGIYQFNESGEVRSVDRVDIRGRNLKGKVLSRYLTSRGYPAVCIYKDGKSTTKEIHRIIAEHFIPNPDNKPEVNHKDGNKLNHCISNLEWVTTRENLLHARATGLFIPAKGERQGNSKLTKDNVLSIRADTRTHREIAADFGIVRQSVSDIKLRKSWRHI